MDKLRNLATTRFITLVVILSASLLAFSTNYYYKNVYLDIERSFWASLDSSLKLDGVAREIENSVGSQSSTNTIEHSFAGELQTRSVVQIDNGGDIVSVQSYGYPDADYIRYDKIELRDEIEQSKAQDAVDVWAVESNQPTQLRDSLVRAFVLFGKIDKSERDQIVDGLRRAYSVNFDNARKETLDDRLVYSYDVEIDLPSFYETLGLYLRAQGLDEFAQFIEEQAALVTSGQSLSMELVIDPRSRNIVEISEASGVQKITSHGTSFDIQRPDTDIDFGDLQQLLE
ncbi:MAG: hypothetical protein AAF413_02775 [Patescibacteria group bacterium]